MTAAADPMMTLRQVAAWLPGSLPVGDPNTTVTRVHTDTRSLQPGDLFVALQGERYDANQFLAQAKSNGAAAAVCHLAADLAGAGLPGIKVVNSKSALGTLATAWRSQFTLPLIGVTGSNGKTTVTQMLAAILRAWKPSATLATQGNLNNDIGVPLTLLRLRAEHQAAVVELGMNHPGEIAVLAVMAQPTVVLVNNAQREHLEFMSTVDAVAHENGAAITQLPPDGVAVFPHGDPFTDLWRTLAGTRTQWTFDTAGTAGTAHPAGSNPAVTGRLADVVCAAPRWVDGAWHLLVSAPGGPFTVVVPAAGRHNVHNALAAVTCALAAGVPQAAITRGMAGFEPVQGRSRIVPVLVGGRPITLVDDSYNANPDSVLAALDLLASLPAPRLMVLGDMGEVGDQGALFHRQAGEYAHALGIETLFTLGELCATATTAHPRTRHFADMQSLIGAVLGALDQSCSVLVKGSRFMKMERVVQAVTASAQQAQKQAQAPGTIAREAPCC